MVDQLEKALPLVGNLTCHEQRASLVHDVIGEDQSASRGFGKVAHRLMPWIASVDPGV